MSGLAMAHSIRRLWPQKVRTRLALTYALLFLASGSVLLGVSYGLLAANLAAGGSALPGTRLSQAQFIELCKMRVNTKLLRLCEEAYLTGRSEGPKLSFQVASAPTDLGGMPECSRAAS